MSKRTTDNDLKILLELQRDADQSLEQIAEKVGISANTCWRRARYLKDDTGYIDKKVTLVNPDPFGFGMTVFLKVKSGTHSKDRAAGFIAAVDAIPEIVELYLLTGEFNYHLKIIVRSMQEYHRVYEELTERVDIVDMSATFAMKRVKYSTEIPFERFIRS